MAIRFKNRKNKLLAIFLAMMMSSSIAAMAACNKSTADSSTEDTPSTDGSTVETDTSRINNGSFEFVDWNNNKTLIATAPTGWSRSVNSASSGTAVSSKADSGIINTDTAAWDNFTKSSLPAGTAAPTNAEEASANWANMSAYDKLNFYKVWADGDFEGKIEEQEFYNASTDKFNVGIEDVPVDKDGNIIANPGTHGEGDDKNVLMIHNTYTGGVGTAQKYTSNSTITLQAGTAAEVSLWVKTSNLTYSTASGSQDVINQRGAYIGVSHTVGGKTLDQLQIKNINTAGVEENNGWVQYTFYVQGSSFTTSSFNMVLGLGQTGGTDRFEYVEGYAFFDDVECKIISSEEYEEKAATATKNVGFDVEGDKKLFYADQEDIDSVALNLNTGAADFVDAEIPTLDIGLTEQKRNNVTYVAADDGNLSDNRKLYKGLGFDISKDVCGVYSQSELIAKAASNEYVKAALTKGFGYTEGSSKLDSFVGDETLFLLSANGANYTAKTGTFYLDAGQTIGISFFVKTSDMLGITGANVTVRYGGTEDRISQATTIANVNTTGIATVDVDDKEDIYQGWQQCFVFIENDTEVNDLAYTLEFSYGPSTIVGTTKDNYIEGWAAFTNLQIVNDLGKAFDYATSGTYSKVVSLFDSTEKEFASSKFDEVAFTTGAEEIKTGLADPRNYNGVKGGSGFVNNDPTADTSVNSNENAGLLSKEYIDAYGEIASMLGVSDLNTVFGNATQPLLIFNKEESAYGFINKSASAISGYTAISLRVKVSAGAVAYVYLADMDDKTHASTLSIDRRVSYWYDANGNVCSKDPTSEEFDKKTDIVLELQENGLYQAKNGGDYYANLKAYTEKDAAGNLLVAEGGVEYNYNADWNNAGVNGIAYYYAGGNYYADAAKTILVKDFSEHGGIPTRYDAAEGKDLSVSVTDTKGEWKTVTFYVAAGAETKNYRLEVWSGSRDGSVKSAANSYVLFDSNTAGSLDATSFDTLKQNAFDHLMDAEGYEDEDALIAAYVENGKIMKNAYSFYDDAKFLRYNKDLDENGVENSYDDYDPTSDSYAEIISYFYYENAKNNSVAIFANYTQNDVTVPTDVVEEDDDHDHEEDSATTETEETNLAMLISSLAVAGVLVAVLAIVGIRKAVQMKRKSSGAVKAVRKAKKASKKNDK